MTFIAANNQQELITKLVEALKPSVEERNAGDLEGFMSRFYSVISFDELRQLPKHDLVGSALSFWQFIHQNDLREIQIQVLNPEFEHHGWHSTHTVIQVCCPDRPFIVDSIRMRLNELSSTIHLLQNLVLDARLSDKGLLLEMEDAGVETNKSEDNIALLYLEVDRVESTDDMEVLRAGLDGVMADVSHVVSDYALISERMQNLLTDLERSSATDIIETQAFVRWLLSDNFTFLGYECVDIKSTAKSVHVEPHADSCFGLFECAEDGAYRTYSKHLDKYCTSKVEGSVNFGKAPIRSTVHRPAYPDCLTFRIYDEKKRPVQEVRVLGLYTSPVYTTDPTYIPYLREKLKGLVNRSAVPVSSHHGKELHQILNVFPRDELFQMSCAELYNTVMDILHIQERRKIKVYLRRECTGLFASCLIYVPRDIYSTDLRMKMQQVLVSGLGALDAEFTTYFSESVLCRVHFILRLDPDKPQEYNQQVLIEEIQQAAYSWEDEFKDAILETKGEMQGNLLYAQYNEGFGLSYREHFSPRTAVVDVEYMTQIAEDHTLGMSFYQSMGKSEGLLHFKVYHHATRLPLSELIPIVENLGLKVIGEFPYRVKRSCGDVVCIHDFLLDFGDSKVDLQRANRIFQEAFREIWFGHAENDHFNNLVLAAYMDWRQVSVLRSYARYLKQIRFGFSQQSIAETLSKHVDITRMIMGYFEARFDPNFAEDEREPVQNTIKESIYVLLEEVSVLNEDRILRRYLDLMNATLRTNFYQLGDEGELKDYVSFKLSPRDIPEVPQPTPMFEIFVYSPKVEGVHLRGGKVARGGLRWSDRLEDYRTEVLGLVKAQQVKNAVIVPVGAKGGFVAKALNASMSREEFMAEGIASYRIFIRALLDVTDNLVDGKAVHPKNVVRYDEDDTYLVVAADKGTATFSDIANEISEKYGFWLGDAFASGGSVGYDHKKMGITARGAWVSVQRHFRELGINIQEETVSVVGVGDMAGDVFGNGMLLSDKLALVAAFNHLHIFIDPDPDIAPSFKERKRLFELPRSSWQDYDEKLISKGGAIFSRSAKSITISKEMKKRFAIEQSKMTPNELITALLKSPVDLIWNGGIGTYIKAKDESHSDVGDKANDILRVDACDLRCKVLGEGGNLGVTQLARVEFGLLHGASNTDFIDNAGGVDCSDHEVNIKILLNEVVASGDLTEKQRNKLLESMTDEVSELVLDNNYCQVEAISLAHRLAKDKMDELKRFINHLEQQGKLDRAIEYLPDNEQITERVAAEQGLARPELSLLISYAKADLKEQLIASDIPESKYLSNESFTAFPGKLVELYPELIQEHRLRREIVSTQIANHLINMMGISFVFRLEQSTGASASEIAKAFVVARDAFDLESYWRQVQALDHKVSNAVQQDMLMILMRLGHRATRWLIRMKRNDLEPDATVDHYRDRVKAFSQMYTELLNEQQREEWQIWRDELVEQGVPEELANFISGFKYLSCSLSITHASDQTQQSLQSVGRMFFNLTDRLDINWFANELGRLEASNHWQSMAKEGIRDELNWQLRALTVAVLEGYKDCEATGDCLEQWVNNNLPMVKRWDGMLTELRSQASNELAMFTVANRELVYLVQSSQ